MLRLRFNQVVAVGALLSSVVIYQSQARGVAGLNNEGCVGSRQVEAVERLKERLPPSDPIRIVDRFCEPVHSRCDGGFVWLPYMINQNRGWVLYTLPKKGNWVGVSIRNICSKRRVLRGDFLNEYFSPYLDEGAAYAMGWALDERQELYQGFDNLVVSLSRPNGEYQVGIYGLSEEKMQSSLLDSFTVSPL
jgi:hypothetical protein